VYCQCPTRREENVTRWYRLAAEQGHARAQLRLGRLYDRGTFVYDSEENDDNAAAVRWYNRFVRSNEKVRGEVPLACLPYLPYTEGKIVAPGLGYSLETGGTTEAVRYQSEEAVRWYSRFVRSNEEVRGEVLCRIGYLLERSGRPAEALQYYERVAKLDGDQKARANAQFKIGDFYERGIAGLPQNYEESTRLYAEAGRYCEQAVHSLISGCLERQSLVPDLVSITLDYYYVDSSSMIDLYPAFTLNYDAVFCHHSSPALRQRHRIIMILKKAAVLPEITNSALGHNHLEACRQLWALITKEGQGHC
jgi:tetratricopeptide (TPR) repeat protein